MRIALASVLLMLTACPRPTVAPAVGAARAAQVACTSSSTAKGETMIPAVPDGVIHQEIVQLSEKGEGGFRIYADGRYESKPMGKPWSLLRTYPPEYVEDLRRIDAQAGLDMLAPVYRAAQPSPGEGRVSFVQVRGVDARIRTIVVYDGCKVAELHALTARLLELHRRF